MIEDFLVPFVVVGLAELGDKTQLAVLLLSSKVKGHARLLLGVLLGFLVVDGVAVLFGSWIVDFISVEYMRVVSGVVFLVFGLLILASGGSGEKERVFSKNAFFSGFALVFLTEWGDKTQIAAGLFASRYNPVLVMAGALAALFLLSVAAVYLGGWVSRRFDRRVLRVVSGVVFILLGVLSLTSAF